MVTIAGHDHLCAAVGCGAIRPEDVLTSCGTAAALVRGVVGQRALLTGFAEGPALQRFLGLLGVDEADRAALDEAAAVVEVGELRVTGIDLPAAGLAGIIADVTPARVWRAALDAAPQRPGPNLWRSWSTRSVPTSA